MTTISIRTAAVAFLGALLCASCTTSGASGADAGMDSGMEPDGSVPNPKCNGHEELCARAYDQVAYPMTHNAMLDEEAEPPWAFPNQNFGITRQLDDGIRAM